MDKKKEEKKLLSQEKINTYRKEKILKSLVAFNK